MKDKKLEAERANKKINQILNGEDDRDSFNMQPLNSNKVSLIMMDEKNRHEK